jgi:hypothetical protein
MPDTRECTYVSSTYNLTADNVLPQQTVLYLVPCAIRR